MLLHLISVSCMFVAVGVCFLILPLNKKCQTYLRYLPILSRNGSIVPHHLACLNVWLWGQGWKLTGSGPVSLDKIKTEQSPLVHYLIPNSSSVLLGRSQRGNHFYRTSTRKPRFRILGVTFVENRRCFFLVNVVFSRFIRNRAHFIFEWGL